jgi:hypothetical protein
MTALNSKAIAASVSQKLHPRSEMIGMAMKMTAAVNPPINIL